MIYRFGPFELDPARFELRKDGVAQHAEPLVFDLLCYLARHPGRVMTRDEIIEAVWQGRIVSDATVSSCIKSARKALGDTGDRDDSRRYIETVRGRGFRFRGTVTLANDDAPADHMPAEDMPAANTLANIGEAPAVDISQVDLTPPGHPLRDTEKPVIAVLPFDNLSTEADDFFADGLTEDIITNLSRFRELLVIARSTTFEFRTRTVSLADFCAEIDASYAVEGSVRRAGGRVRISAQLIDARTGGHVWADTYDRDMQDIFAVQDEVTRTIAATLGVRLQDAGLQRAMRKSPAELDAYECVQRARQFTYLLSATMHAEARDLLEKAVSLDPDNAEAHALLANVYLAEHRIDANPRPDPVTRALASAETATRLDPQNGYARCWLAIVHFFRHENDKFEAEAERALNLNPNDPEILADIGHYLAFMGAFERGVALSTKARQLNPLHPGWYYFSQVRLLYNQRDYGEVPGLVQKIGLPHFYWSHMLNAAAWGQLADPRAAGSLARIFELKPDFSARDELQKWNAAPDDLAHLLDGLSKAGLRQ